MSRFGVELIGLEKALAIADRAKGRESILGRAVYGEASTILNESKRIVPVESGNLRASGRVEKPSVSPGKVSVEVSYGGAAAPYAWIVHEVPPDSGGRGGQGYKHKPGKTYKYLEIPAMAHKDKFVAAVKARVADMLLRGR